MNTIQTNEQTININFETQIGTIGRPFRLSGVRKRTDIPCKWINRIECYHWIYSFRYLDDQDGFFEIEIDYNNNYVKQ